MRYVNAPMITATNGSRRFFQGWILMINGKSWGEGWVKIKFSPSIKAFQIIIGFYLF